MTLTGLDIAARRTTQLKPDQWFDVEARTDFRCTMLRETLALARPWISSEPHAVNYSLALWGPKLLKPQLIDGEMKRRGHASHNGVLTLTWPGEHTLWPELRERLDELLLGPSLLLSRITAKVAEAPAQLDDLMPEGPL